MADKRSSPEDSPVKISATWDSEFGKSEPGTDAIFLMAGETCLGYVHRSGGKYMACVGAGLEAPTVYYGADLTEATRAVEAQYK